MQLMHARGRNRGFHDVFYISQVVDSTTHAGGRAFVARAEYLQAGHNGAMADAAPLTDLLRRAQDGDETAMRLVFDATYEELCRLAHVRLRKGGRGTFLDTSSLVHESYLRFAKAAQLRLEDRQHFLRYAGHVMRSVIVDFVRVKLAERRGGDAPHVTLSSEVSENVSASETEILRVHEALEELSQYDTRMVEVVELRYFAGMTEAEIAEALGVTDRTVRRDWEKARLFLAKALK
jgi:RNA polymerase sigma factor (TIGR02999 family)